MPFRDFSVNGSTQENWSSYFQKLETWEFMNESLSMGVAQFHDPGEEDVLGQVLANSKTFSFRWGQGDPSASPWNHYVIYAVDTDYNPSGGTNIRVYFCDHSIRMRLNSTFAAFDDSPKDTIVTSIMKYYQKTYYSEYSTTSQLLMPDPVVEPALPASNDLQAGHKDWDYLTMNCEGAVSANTNLGDYRLFWLRGVELHFHPPDYTQKPYINLSIRGGNDIKQFTLRSSPWRRSINGGELTVVRGFSKNSITDYEVGMNLSKIQATGITSTGRRDVGSLLDPADTDPNTIFGLYRASIGDESIASQMSIDTFFKQFNRSYDAEIRMSDDPNMQVGQLIYITSPNPSGQANNAQGMWLVEEIYRDIKKGSDADMNVRLSRSLSTKGQEKLTGVKLNPNTQANPTGSGIVSGNTLSVNGASSVRKVPVPIT